MQLKTYHYGLKYIVNLLWVLKTTTEDQGLSRFMKINEIHFQHRVLSDIDGGNLVLPFLDYYNYLSSWSKQSFSILTFLLSFLKTSTGFPLQQRKKYKLVNAHILSAFMQMVNMNEKSINDLIKWSFEPTSASCSSRSSTHSRRNLTENMCTSITGNGLWSFSSPPMFGLKVQYLLTTISTNQLKDKDFN